MAEAATVHVHPGGGGNTIQRAVNLAHAGDTLAIHDGRYREDVEVDKRLKLRGAGDGRPVVDGTCDAQDTINVDHNRVVLKDLKVVGARDSESAAEVNFRLIERGTVRNVVVRDTCGDGPTEGAGYGINVLRGEQITVEDVNAKGFSDAGIYIGDIDTTGKGELRVADNVAHASAQGIIIEEVEEAADVFVLDNTTRGNGKGLFVHVSDAVSFTSNTIRDNATGLHLDSGSDGNVFTSNVFTDNTADVQDEGTGNCGSGNTPELFPACP